MSAQAMAVPDLGRAERALAALRQAEHRTGARRVEMPDRAAAPLGVRTRERPALPVPHELSDLLPHGLTRGSVTEVTGSLALVLALLAEACGRVDELGEEPWAAVVGHPRVGLLAAAHLGVPLDRLVLVPEPGDGAAAAVAALVDGMDVVVLGDLPLLDADRRRLTARARERGTVLLSTAPWRGAGAVLRATGVRWRGLGQGTGRLVARELTVERADRVRARIDVVLPFGEQPVVTPRATPRDAAPHVPATAPQTTPAAVAVAVAQPALRLVG